MTKEIIFLQKSLINKISFSLSSQNHQMLLHGFNHSAIVSLLTRLYLYKKKFKSDQELYKIFLYAIKNEITPDKKYTFDIFDNESISEEQKKLLIKTIQTSFIELINEIT